jgi:hypothetical protein
MTGGLLKFAQLAVIGFSGNNNKTPQQAAANYWH